MAQNLVTIRELLIGVMLLPALVLDAEGAPPRVPTLVDVMPIVRAHCGGCHSANGPAPFPLTNAEQLRKRSQQIVEVTSRKYMPPWLPRESRFRFANERRLTEEEITILQRWNEGGAPVGEPLAHRANRQTARTWQLGEPDLILTPEAAFDLKAEGADVFWNVVIPTGLNSTHYVRTVEIIPGNRAVHHMIGLYDRTGTAKRRDALTPAMGFPGMEYGQAEIPAGQSMLWSPGKVPAAGRPGIAWRIDSETDIVLQMHMLPSGKPEKIQPRIGLYFAAAPPSLHPISVMLEADSIDIPAGEQAYEVTEEIRLPVDVELLSIYPHAHYLATRVECEVALPTGEKLSLLKIDDWDFNWQDEYQFQDPVKLTAHSVIQMRFTYNNSADNPRNPHSPPRRVVLGNQSTDEMGSILLQMLVPSEADRQVLDESRWVQKLHSMPFHPTANQNLGNIFESRGELQKALECYRRVLQVLPDDCVAHDNVACALSASGEFRRAAEHFRQAIELDPQFALGYSHWGVSLMRQNRVAEAIQKFARALELWPQFPEARIHMGQAELMRGNTAAAAQEFRLAVKHSPDYALAHFNLGTVLMNAQQFEEAADCFRRAVAIDDEFPEAFNNLGIVLFQLKQLQESATQFQRAILLNPEDEHAKQNLKIVEAKLAEM